MSKARSSGLQSPPCVVEHAPAPLVKSVCPITRKAFSPFKNGVLNSRTRLLKRSAAQRFPLESNAMPNGSQSPLCVVEHVLLVKFGWPITIEAFSSSENGGSNLNTRPLPSSATQR